jgi:cytochrome P450
MTDFSTFHRDPHRGELYARQRGQPPVYDDVYGGYVVLDPDQVHELLTRKDVDASNTDLSPIEQRFKVDLSDIKMVVSHMPLLQTGEWHAETRRRLAIFLAARKPAFKEWLETRLPVHLAPFLRTGSFEAVGECFLPMFSEMTEVFLGHELPEDRRFEWISLLFDMQLGMRKRQRVYDEIREFQHYVAEKVGLAPDSADVLNALTTMVFGREPLTGTFGKTVYDLIATHPGHRMDQLPYADMPSSTAVPFAERVAVNRFTFHGLTIEPGTNFKLYLQSMEASGEERYLPRLFGAGAHVCPGRPLATDAWKKVVEVLKTSTLRARIVRYEINDANYLFNLPRIMELEMSV